MQKTILFIAVFLVHGLLSAQKKVVWWTDTTSSYVNNRVVDIIESGDHIHCLSSATDERYQSPHIGITTLSLNGDKVTYRIAKEMDNIYQVNCMVIQPDSDIRIYGTNNQGLVLVPFVYTVNAAGTFRAQTASLVNVSHYLGDAVNIGANDCIWAKAIRGSQTNTYNNFVYRFDMSAGDQQKWRCKLESEFNEEAKKLVVMPDSGVILLARRYTDASMVSYIPVLYRIDGTGEKIWERPLPQYADPEDMNIAADKSAIYFVTSAGNENNGKSEGDLVKLNLDGTIAKAVKVDSLNAKGLLVLKSGKLLLYGGYYTTSGFVYLKKAKVASFSTDLIPVKSSVLGPFDDPDASLPSLAASTTQATSSDILTAIQLKDNRVVFGGRVYMALHTSPTEILYSLRTNRNMAIFSGEEGVW